MEIKDFFTFSSKHIASNFRAPPVGLKINDETNLTKGIYTGIEFSVVFKHSHGKKLTDILHTEYPSLYLISDRMKIILEKNKLIGWKTFLIKLYDKKEEKISGYHGFSITGRCGPIDYKKSEVIEKRVVPTGPLCKFYKGLYVGLDEWDKTDFFLPQDNLGIIITKRAAEILKNEKITNMDLENLCDYKLSSIVVEWDLRKN